MTVGSDTLICMSNEGVLQVAAKAIVVNAKGELLVLRESAAHDTNTNAGRYQFPGGRLEPQEPFLDGLRREVQEETGLHVVPQYPFQVGEWWPVIHGVKHQIVAIFVICELPEGKTVITLSEEHDAFMWVGAENRATCDLMNPDNDIVDAYIAAHSEQHKKD
jgi:8-oxo-dGTP diphosphatase